MFITENCCSKFTIMSFWVPALNSPAENGIPKNPLDTSLTLLSISIYELYQRNREETQDGTLEGQ